MTPEQEREILKRLEKLELQQPKSSRPLTSREEEKRKLKELLSKPSKTNQH